MQHIRMLALDIDGTLAEERDRVSGPTLEAVDRAHRSGVTVAIATGRRYRTAMRIVDLLGFTPHLVCLGGALVKDTRGDTLHASPFPAEEFAFVTGCFRDHGQTAIGQCAADGSGAAPDFLIDQTAGWNDFTSRYFDNNQDHARTFGDDPKRAPHAGDVLVIGAFGPSEELAAVRDEIDRRAPGRFFQTLMSANPVDEAAYLEVIPADVSKWHGLLHVARAAGIAPEAICAVGDERNDLPMIRGAGVGVAMGNALPEVQAEADWVTGRHDADGVVTVIERILVGRD